MGANYDLIVSPAPSDAIIVRYIREFLATRGMTAHLPVALGSVEINDDKAILFGRPSNGWVQILASSTSFGASFTEWFHCNPLAIYLSSQLRYCVHLWTLDSGYVAGYSIYENGKLTDCECAFSKHAQRTDELLDGVPTPASRGRGESIGRLMTTTYKFRDSASQCRNLEHAIGDLVSRFGFDAHLMDLYDALDDHRGAAIKGHAYDDVELEGWTALVFERERSA